MIGNIATIPHSMSNAEENISHVTIISLPPDVTKAIAHYLSTKEAFQYAQVHPQIKKTLNLKAIPMFPSRLLRTMGGAENGWVHSRHCIQTIPLPTSSQLLHSIHIHCKWTWAQMRYHGKHVTLEVQNHGNVERSAAPRLMKLDLIRYNLSSPCHFDHK